MIMGFGDKLRNFMYGRYGRDHLNLFLTIVSFILLIIGVFVRAEAAWILLIAALILLTVSYYRMFSRNYAKRYAENQKFLSVIHKITGKKRQLQDKDHAYFKCPKCKKQLRVPKGKGRIQIHCPQCGTDFIENT